MTGPNALPLKIAVGNYGHTASLKAGRAPIEGVIPDFVEVNPIIAAFRRMVRDVEFDVCEMAPATYMIARAAGAPFKALPIFVYRRFHHEGLVCRKDSGISAPKDLEGKKVGVRAYSVSTGIWTRGILANEYDVDNSKITWVVDDEEHVTSLRLPANVIHSPPGESLLSMISDGQLQAAFTGPAGIGRAGAPKDGWEANKTAQDQGYDEIFPNASQLEAEWFHRTGIYPVHGLIVVKDKVLSETPWVAKSLFNAFVKSKKDYLEQLSRGEIQNDVDRHYQALTKVVGDPLPYGIASNLPAIEALIKYSFQQGLLPREFSVDELFVDPEKA
jgi:4,5-dihydroxyphthalate decarboxylase